MSDTDPLDVQIPTVEELDRVRQSLGVSNYELSQRAGKHQTRWGDMVRRDVDPRVSTMRSFIDALRELAAERDAESTADLQRVLLEQVSNSDQRHRPSTTLKQMDPDDLGGDPSPPAGDPA